MSRWSQSPSKRARLTELFRRHARVAYRTLVACGVTDTDADDCTTQVFEIVLERLDDIRPGAERSFVCAVAARVASNARRSRERRLAHFALLSAQQWEGLPAQDDRQDPERQAQRSRGRALLARALERMSDAQRPVFVLCELERCTAKEAAEALEIAESAVHARLRKARASFTRFCGELTREEASQPAAVRELSRRPLGGDHG